jgi:hypothetical protein
MMPQIWTDKQIRVSDQLLEIVADAEFGILREVALDSLNRPDAWTPVGDRHRCSFLGRDGLPILVEIGVATVGSDLATVFAVRLKDARLADLSTPLMRVDEFEKNYVDTDYRSKAVSERPVMKVRLGEVRRLQPMKYDPEE